MSRWLVSVLLIGALSLLSGCATAIHLPESEASDLASRRAAVFAGADVVDLTVADAKFDFHVTSAHAGTFSLGTAFPVTADGYLLTAAHVLDTQGGAICVYLHAPAGQAGAFLPADLVYVDPVSDLAVLKVTRSIARPFRLADATPAVGAELVSTSTTRGSQRGRLLAILAPRAARPRLEFARDTKNGDSGGAVLDSDGRTVGVIVQGGLDWRWSGIERIAIAPTVDTVWWASVAPTFSRDERYRPAAELANACRLITADSSATR